MYINSEVLLHAGFKDERIFKFQATLFNLFKRKREEKIK